MMDGFGRGMSETCHGSAMAAALEQDLCPHWQELHALVKAEWRVVVR